ncbi:hypothetical protein IKW73_01185 [Candidatus Saccharibacteria bacterium]|nr:hypothetical protein [Candidatus Saccharibacteria bacterium]
MENNYIQREFLGKFVDGLIAQKYPGQPAENYKDIREASIKDIDERIDWAIYGSLNKEQLAEVNELFDRNEENPEVFAAFFEKAGVDPQQKITEVLDDYQKSFLGGSNE